VTQSDSVGPGALRVGIVTLLSTTAGISILACLAGDSSGGLWRSVGSVLELLGFAVVVLELETTLEQHGDRVGPVLRATRRIDQLWGKIIGRTHRVSSSATSWYESRASDCVAPDLRDVAPDAEAEERLDTLEYNVDQINTALRQAQIREAGRVESINAKLKRHIEALGGRVEDVREEVRHVAVGSVRLEALGVGFFVLGVVLSTWGEPMGELLTRLLACG